MTYSTPDDIKDEMIKQFSKHTDHEEARDYIDKVLAKSGVTANTKDIMPLLKQLSVTYATYKRAFYEAKTKDDVFYQKYIGYERDLKALTAKLIRVGLGKNLQTASKLFHDAIQDI